MIWGEDKNNFMLFDQLQMILLHLIINNLIAKLFFIDSLLSLFIE